MLPILELQSPAGLNSREVENSLVMRGKSHGTAHTANVFLNVGSNSRRFFRTVINTVMEIINMLKSMACTEN